MTNRWMKISTALMLAASAAAAQTAPNYGALFDGGKGLKGFTPQSVVPVIRDTKESETPRIGSLRADDVPAVGEAVDLVPVAIEVEIPLNASQVQALSERVGRLSADYLFHPDPSFEPIRLLQFRIQPFPPLTEPHAAYLLRGRVPAPRVERIKQDVSVKQVYQDRSADPKALEELVLRYGKALRREGGVAQVYVGFDCGVQGPHQHIRAHQPAIVIETDGSLSVKSVRQSVFQSIPALALEPIVFVQK